MANICSNKFYFECENNFQKYLDDFKTVLECDIEVGDYYNNGGCCDGWFESRWIFPMTRIKGLFDPKDNCYFRCLSEEYGCGYVAMNIYEDGEWRDEQCFDL